jgi:hypothetical protein
MIAAVVPFRARNFARELLLRKLEREAEQARMPVHILDLMRHVHSAPHTLVEAMHQEIRA